MLKYNLFIFIHFFLLLNSPYSDETVNAANLSKPNSSSKLNSTSFTNTYPFFKEPVKTRDKVVSDIKVKNGNYYGNKHNMCAQRKRINKPILESKVGDNTENLFEEPPVATNIKVADAVVLQNDEQQVMDVGRTNSIMGKEENSDATTERTVTVTQELSEKEATLQVDKNSEPKLPVEKNSPIDAAEQQQSINVSREIESAQTQSSDEENGKETDVDNTSNEAKVIEDDNKNQDTEKGATDEISQPTAQPTTVDESTTETATAGSVSPTTHPDDDDLQSFEEWKKKQIQSQEVAATSETTSSHQRTIRTKKTQMNYASQDCGAKVLSHNIEAKHVGAILDENKDLYMLNPCKERIWFVVELCEPIQIEQIQLANLELFSSMFHLFELHISERFPAREWRNLGTFEARNERVVQTFNSKDNMFAKYLKFEMKSHFGNEHFCPLTLIRVLGVSMVEEYEDHEEEKNRKEEKEDGRVKAVLDEKINPATSDTKDAEEGGSIGNNVLNIVKNVVGKVGNLLANGNSDVENATASNSETPTDYVPQNDSQDDVIDAEWESPVTLVTNKSEMEDSSKKRPVITLIETGDGKEVVYIDPTDPPLYPLKFLKQFSAKNFGTRLCWFLEFMYRVSILSCVVKDGNRTVVDGAFSLAFEKEVAVTSDSFAKANTSSMKTSPDAATNFVLLDKTKQAGSDNDESKPTTLPTVDSEAFVKDTPNSTKIGKPNVTLSESQHTQNVSSKNEEKKQTDNVSQEVDNSRNETLLDKFKRTITKSDDENPTCDKTADQSSKSLEKIEKTENNAPESEHPKPSQDDEVKTIEISVESDKITQKDIGSSKVKSSENEVPKISKEIALEEPPTAAPELDEKPVSGSNEDVFTPAVHEETSSSKTPSSTTPSPPEQNMSETEDTVVINPGTNQKESVLMRLSNRIRTLEQNLSLSSAYLENLSRRYKRQMDEMQRTFNQTQSKLKEMSAVVEENNIKHTRALEKEAEKLQQLRSKCQDLEASTEQLNRDMVARHFCLMALESIILIVISVTCYSTRHSRLIRKIEETDRKIEILLHNEAKNLNGFSKFSSSDHTKQSRLKEQVLASHKIGDGHMRTLSKPKSNVLDRVPSWTTSPTSPCLSNTTLPRKKGIAKTFGSPIKKRKSSLNGKMVKATKSANGEVICRATSCDNNWTTDLPKSQKIAKIKKHQVKNEYRNGRVTQEVSSNFNLLYSNKNKSDNFSNSSCQDPSLWQKCTSLSRAFVGKAR